MFVVGDRIQHVSRTGDIYEVVKVRKDFGDALAVTLETQPKLTRVIHPDNWCRVEGELKPKKPALHIRLLPKSDLPGPDRYYMIASFWGDRWARSLDGRGVLGIDIWYFRSGQETLVPSGPTYFHSKNEAVEAAREQGYEVIDYTNMR